MEPLAYDELTASQLDARVEEARVQHLRRKKRSYLEALERGEDPPYTSDLDIPLSRSETAEKPKRPRHETWSKVTLPTPKYHGKNWSELVAFLADLEAVFVTHPDDFEEETRRAVYVGTCLQGDTKRRWTNFLNASGGVNHITWDEAKKWLKDQQSDEPTRAFEATKKLDGLYQQPNQTCRAFLDIYEAAEAELPGTEPELHRVSRALHRLLQKPRERLVSSGIPTDWQALRRDAIIADTFLGLDQSKVQPRRQNEATPQGKKNGGQTQQNSTEPPQGEEKEIGRDRADNDASWPGSRRIECFRYGGPHKQPEYTEPGCDTYGRKNHTTEKHDLWVQKKWPPPIRDGWSYGQRGSGVNPETLQIRST